MSDVHSLCGVLGLDFRKTVVEVHPSLHETSPGKPTSISNKTLEGLAKAILKLKADKKIQLQKVMSDYSLFRTLNFQPLDLIGIVSCIDA